MLTQCKWLLPAGLSLVTMGCLAGPLRGLGCPDADRSLHKPKRRRRERRRGRGEETGSPVALEEEDAPVERCVFKEMDVTYTYSGSFGEFADICDGSAFVFIEDGNVEAKESAKTNHHLWFSDRRHRL